MTTGPIDVETELERLLGAVYDLCAAFLTMLLREDYFSNGAFERRYSNDSIKLLKALQFYLKNISKTINKEEIKIDSSSVAFDFFIPYKDTVNEKVESGGSDI